jgi:diketogulonate reductase-like aldo/keto reductase
MLTRRIPSSSGESIPIIGVGTWQTFDVGHGIEERARLSDVLATFVTLGGKTIDSSPMYGSSEQVVGELAATLGLHSKLFIATKVWTSGKAAGIRQMEDSMRKLGVKRIDLMQVHNLIDVDTHLDTLAEWKHRGLVRYVGVTHYNSGGHDAVGRILVQPRAQPLDFIQINYSVGEREAERRLLPLARDRGVAVIANRPFGGGDLIRRLSRRPVPAWAAEVGCTSWPQLLLKFVVSHPAITCAIPATSNVAHLRENMQAGGRGLPDEGMRSRVAAEAAR